jgi:hypothetical protein
MHSKMIAFTLSFLAFTSATPLQRRCLPNFGGPEGLSIENGGSEWVVAGTSVGTGTTDVGPEFRVEFTGQPNNDFLIKCVDHIDLCFGSGLILPFRPVGFPELRVGAVGTGLQIVTPNSSDR